MSATLSQLGENEFAPVTVAATPAGQSATPLTGGCRLGGWSLVESTGAAAATAELRDGAQSGGDVVAEISLGIGQAESKVTPGKGIKISSALTLVVLTGSVRGSLWVNLT